jgi:low affinity Fe/Cu permease
VLLTIFNISETGNNTFNVVLYNNSNYEWVIAMEQKIDMLIEMMAGMREDMTRMDERMNQNMKEMNGRFDRMEKENRDRFDVLANHMANIENRFSTTDNIKKLYSEEALKAVQAV